MKKTDYWTLRTEIREDFISALPLLLLADEVVHKKAYCSKCGAPAIFSQKVGTDEANGQIDIGDEKYEPRCRCCYTA